MNLSLLFRVRVRLAVFLALGFLVSDCRREEDEPDLVTYLLRIDHKTSGLPLVSDRRVTDSSGQIYTVSRLNYFVSNIKLRNRETGDVYFETDSYHLVRALQNPSNSEIILRNVPRKKYTELELSIGVDNAVNRSTDRTGDLDPASGMAWDWTTGYKFMELEGRFQAGTDSGSYVYHIGEDPCYRTFTFRFADVLSTPLEVTRGGEIILEAEIASAFGRPNPIQFASKRQVMSASGGGTQIAENYGRAFFKLVGAR